MNDSTVNKVIRSYTSKQLSGVEIAKSLKLPIRQIYRILDSNKIARRKIHESNAIRFWKEPLSFTVKRRMTVNDRLLMTIGVMLYWAEGAGYQDKTMLDFTNSDPWMIKLYLKFLRKICGVDEKRIRIYLFCYPNQDKEKLRRYWSRVTKIPLCQFIKPYVRKNYNHDGNHKMKHGLIHVRYADKKLYIQFESWHRGIVLKSLGVNSEMGKSIIL